MSLTSRLAAALFGLQRRRRRGDEELDEEIRTHLRMAEQARVDAGASRDEAAAAARREFGNVTLIKEVTREMWGWTSLDRVAQDARYAVRALRQSPAFALIAVLSLALGIGANTAAFSIADAVLLRPLGIARPAEVLAISSASPQNASEPLSYPDIVDLRAQTHAFDDVVAFATRRLAVARAEDPVPQPRIGMIVSGRFFGTLGVQPVAGRAFTEAEARVPGDGALVVLGYDFWKSAFGASPDAIGRTLRLNGVPFTIVGVAPEPFSGMNPFMRPAFYVPLTMADRLSSGAASSPATTSLLERREDRAFSVRGRLKPGVTLAAAQAELTMVARSLERAYPETHRGRTLVARTELQARMQEAPANTIVAAMLVGLAGLVLVIACANVAGLLLARAGARTREIAVRLAIGAGRARLFQQLLTESLVLALGAGVMGLIVAYGAIRYLAAIQLPTDTPLVLAVQLDRRVLWFSLAASIVSALLFGLVPAWRAVKPELTSALKSSDAIAHGRVRLAGRQVLVAGQVALSLVLVVIAVTLVGAFRKMLLLDPGVRTERLMMMEMDPALIGYGPDQTREFYTLLLARMRALPGVQAATLTAGLPFKPNFLDEGVVPEGYELPRDQRSVTVSSNVIDTDFFETMGTAIVRGRAFSGQDASGAPRVAIVNEEFARRYWPGQEALGKRFRLGEQGAFVSIIGVTPTGKYLSLAEAPQPYFYLPRAQRERSRLTLLVRTAGDPIAMTRPLMEAVRAIDARQPVANVRTFQQYYEAGALGVPQLMMRMVGAMGLVGLLLALIGLYGLVSYSVNRRTREIGIRMAIGARRVQVVTLVLRQAVWLTLAGVCTGVALSLPVRRGLAAGLAGLGGVSAWTMVVSAGGVMIVTLAACLVPAYRACRIDPTRALRQE